MTLILIDYGLVINNNLSLLKEKIKDVPETPYSIGLILKICKKEISNLESLPYGIERINYLNNPKFIDCIEGYCFIICDMSNNICEIKEFNSIKLFDIVEILRLHFPTYFKLVYGIDIKARENKMKELAVCGFGNCIISKTSPLNFSYPSYILFAFRKNDTSEKNTLYEIKYAIKEFKAKDSSCGIKLKFSKESIDYLKKVCFTGSTLNKDGSITQKEVAGNFFVKSVDKNLVHTLDIDEKSIAFGTEESVNVSNGLYNFHSHPVSAYKNNKVSIGWPSGQDYVGYFIGLKTDKTIFHVVISLEGLYIISKNDDWDINMNGVEEFIYNNYNYDRSNETDSSWFIKDVNSLKYKGVKLFLTTFVPWSKSKKSFKVKYVKTNNNCYTVF